MRPIYKLTPSFQQCGHDCMDLEIMMRQCYKELTVEELHNMKYHVEEDCEFQNPWSTYGS
eukprot:scaffold7643_cov218-Ochromonas_danica.AAC.1